MEWAGQRSGTVHLVGQPGKIISFERKFSNHTELSQPDFTIPSQPSKQAGPLPDNHNPGKPAHQQDRMLFWAGTVRNLTEKKTWQQ